MTEPTFGRYTEIPLNELTPAQRHTYDQVLESRGQVPGPYKIFVQNSHLMKILIPTGVYFNKGHSSLADAERTIAVNLINGKWLAAFSNHEHEKIGQRAGQPAEKIEALIAGLPTAFDDPRQQVVYELTSALIAPRVIPESLYQRAVKLLGDIGITDLTALIGYYTTVSLTLRTYDVPAGAEGLTR